MTPTEPFREPWRGFSWAIAWVVIPVVLGSLVLVQTRQFAVTTSETYDEYTYLRMGICIYRDHDFASLASPMCPPLPILLEYWLPALQSRDIPGSDAWEREVPSMTRQARLLTATTLGVPLVMLIYSWLSWRRGWLVGALGGGMAALSPTILAAASVATTDACFALFGVVALVTLHWYQVRPKWWTYLLAGGGIGLALASKQSAAVLFGVALGELLIQQRMVRQPGWTWIDYGLRYGWRVGIRLSGLVALAFLTDWTCYGFHSAGRYGAVGVTTTMPVVIPMVAALLPNGEAIVEAVRNAGPPLAIDTFVGQMRHAAEGQGAYLMGQHSSHGWWYFFPVALAIKSTPAELILMALLAGFVCQASVWRDPTRRLWLAAALLMLAAGMASSINIGHRYMLLIYPLVILLGSDWLGSVRAHRSRWAIGFGSALLAWQAVSAIGIAPHYLSYFNSLCGGPMAGHRYLVDSSIDWGQDLPALRLELEARHYRQVALNYFGTAQAETYGLRTVDWITPDDAVAAQTDFLAISATRLQGAYGGNATLADQLQRLPSIRAGYSIFIYDLKDPAVRATWDAMRHPERLPTSNDRPRRGG